jgi:hypothetical protein
MVVAPNRYVLTNHHVFENARPITMSLPDPLERNARHQPDRP